MALLKLDELAFGAAQVLDAKDRTAAHGTSLHLDIATRKRLEGHGKTLAARPQGFDRTLGCPRLVRLQPGAERECAARNRRPRDARGFAEDLGLLAAGGPGRHDLLFGQQQRIFAIDVVLERQDLGAIRDTCPHGARARSHQDDCGHHREKYNSDSERERSYLMSLECRKSAGTEVEEDGRIGGARCAGIHGSGEQDVGESAQARHGTPASAPCPDRVRHPLPLGRPAPPSHGARRMRTASATRPANRFILPASKVDP